MRKWYAKPENAAVQKSRSGANAKRTRADNRERLREAKSAPCTDCAETFPPECMDFDHLDGSTKLGNVSAMTYGRMPWSAVAAEIAKCELVCANCHRIRTARRRGVV